MIDPFATFQLLVIPAGAGPGTPRIVIGPTLPPPLDTYQFTTIDGPIVASGGIIFWSTSLTSFNFIALVRSTTTISIRTGYVLAGVVSEYAAGIPYGQYWQLFGGGQTQIGLTGDQLWTLAGGPNADDWRIDNVSQGRGLAARIDSNASSAAIGAETVVLDTGNFTIVDGRAYRVRFRASELGSVVNQNTVRIRKTNALGQALFAGLFPCPNTVQESHYAECYFVRTAGADLTTNIVLTINASAGTVTQIASAAQIRYLEVEDCGAAGAYGFSPAIL